MVLARLRCIQTLAQGIWPPWGAAGFFKICMALLQSTVTSKSPETLLKSSKSALCSAAGTESSMSRQEMLATRLGPSSFKVYAAMAHDTQRSLVSAPPGPPEASEENT